MKEKINLAATKNKFLLLLLFARQKGPFLIICNWVKQKTSEATKLIKFLLL
jgi:hypothetical protein